MKTLKEYLRAAIFLPILTGLLGCSFSPSFGPNVEEKVIFVSNSAPCRIVSDKELDVLVPREDGTAVKGKRRLQGFYAMPKEVYDEVRKALPDKSPRPVSE